jgi:hypothetical protein
MIDEDEGAGPDAGEALLYDFFKHLTSLCLFSLGGVLALTEKVHGSNTGLLVGALVIIGTAALLSFSGAGEIVGARYKRLPLRKHLNYYRVISPVLLSTGLGMFLYLFLQTLKP